MDSVLQTEHLPEGARQWRPKTRFVTLSQVTADSNRERRVRRSGQLAALIRDFDWAATPLGPFESWSERLKTLVDLMLASPLLSTIACGPERILLYNDEAATRYGDRHPGVLGLPLAVAFPETYPSVALLYDRAFAGEAVCVPAQPMDLQNTGQVDVFEAYLTPVRDEHGAVLYVYMSGFEISGRLASEAERDQQARLTHESKERQALLLRLSDAVRRLPDAMEIQAVAVDLLGEFLEVNNAHFGEIIGEYVHVYHSYGRGLPPMTGKFHPDSFGKRMKAGYLAGELQITCDTSADPLLSDEERQMLATARIGAYMAAPLVKSGEWVAILAVNNITPRIWKQSEIELLQEVAERTWAAVERARAEKALAASEQNFRTLFNSIDEGFNTVEVLFDEQHRAVDVRILAINPAYERITGLRQEAVTGQSLRAIMPSIEDRIIERYGRVALTGEPSRFEEYVSALDSWFDCYASRSGSEGSRVVAVVFNNVTERKRAEERQAYLLKLSDALRALTDPVEIQDAAMQTLGQHLGVERAYYFEAQRDTDEFRVGRGYSAAGALPQPRSFRIVDFGDFVVDAYRQGQTVVISDAQQDARMDTSVRAAFEAAGTRAAVGVPLVKAGHLVAAVGVIQSTPRVWTLQEQSFLEETAQRTWAAVESARAHAALRESEERQRTLLERMPQLVWRSHHYGHWTWASPQWMRFTGLNQEESLGHGWMDALHPDDRDATLRAWELAPVTGILDVEYRVRRALDQTYRYHRTRALPIHNEQCDILEWLGTSTDIEDLKQAEAARREAEEQLRLFVENVQEYAFVQTDQGGRITSWNPGASRLFGYHPDQMMGQEFSVLLTPEDLAQGVFRQELAAVTSGKRNEDARWCVRHDGSLFWARWITEPVYDAAGRFQGLAKVLRDETYRRETEQALRQSEEQLRRAIEVETIGVLFFKTTGEITYANDTFLRMSGYTRKELQEGLVRWDEMTPQEHMAPSLDAIQQFLSLGRVQPYEKEYVRKDGLRWWGLFVASRISADVGVEFILDITDRRRVEQALQASLAEKEELLKEVHHRVKNNLQVIMSLLNLQTTQIHDEGVLTLFEETRNRVQSIASIHELLYHSESFARIQLSAYARQLVAGLVRFYGLDGKIEVEFRGDGATLELERAVPYGMLLNELISNSCKHAFAGGRQGRLTVTIQADESSIELMVSDDGPGLPAGFDSARACSLGLKLVHGLARQLRGSAEFSTAPGTTVRVRFPARGTEREE